MTRGSAIEVVSTGLHLYGRPPIERVLYRRRIRCTNVGVNRYEAICELSRAIYNLDSELVLSDSSQAHPTIQGPAALLADGQIAVGPANVLPMLETQGQDGQVTFTGWSYVSPPKGPADSIRANKQAYRDDIDRIACLTKPAGAQGTTGATVAQSGLSKVMDQSTGNDLLTNLASAMARLEWTIASLALRVLGNGKVAPADLAAVKISYPKTFELADPASLTAGIEGFQGVLATSGATPKNDTFLAKRLSGLMTPGVDPDFREELDEEIEEFIEAKAGQVDQDNEANAVNPTNTKTPAPTDQTIDAEPDDLTEEE